MNVVRIALSADSSWARQVCSESKADEPEMFTKILLLFSDGRQHGLVALLLAVVVGLGSCCSVIQVEFGSVDGSGGCCWCSSSCCCRC